MIDIDQLIKKAMLNKASTELKVYRAIKTKITEFKSAKNAKVYDEVAELQLIDKMRRERLDSAEQYRKGGREDLADMEIYEATILDKFLPVAPSPDDIIELITTTIADEFGYTNTRRVSQDLLGLGIPKKDMGKVIKRIKELEPLADGKIVSDIVKIFLQ